MKIEEETKASEHSDRLHEAVGKMRLRGPRGSLERWLMIAGAALVGIGIPAILAGWYGASHTPYVFEQVPYLISGGILGLSLSIVGGLCYFAYWMTRQIQETRNTADRTTQALGRIEALLAGNGSAPSASAANGNGTYVATAKGTMFHRPDCVVVAGKPGLRSVDPSAAGFEPCKICDPVA